MRLHIFNYINLLFLLLLIFIGFQNSLSIAQEDLTSPTKVLNLKINDAIMIALDRNKSLKIQKLNPKISELSIQQAKGSFDPNFSAKGSVSEDRAQVKNIDGNDDDKLSHSRNTSMSIDGRLYTGTNYSLSTSNNRSETGSDENYSASYQFQITQNLLKGFGLPVNLANIKLAENRYKISKSAFRNALINLVYNVQNNYWNLYLAKETVRIRKEALNVAKEQKILTKELVRLGKVAEIELLSADAEEASRYSNLINAESELKKQNLQLIKLLSPEDSPILWDNLIITDEKPEMAFEDININDHVEIAKKYRPDLEQAKIDLENGELEVIQTKNGLMPKLDFVAGFGSRGRENEFDDSYGTASEFKYTNWNLGLEFSTSIMNRSARAQYKRARFSKLQAMESIDNLEEQIELEIRIGAIEIERTNQQIDATKAAKKLSEESLRAEKEKFRVGRSTNLLVSQAQRDFISAEINELNAVVGKIKSYIDFYKLEGSILYRNGLNVEDYE